jgi:hypothetical protein
LTLLERDREELSNYSTILPLIVMLLLGLLHSHLVPQFLEPKTPKGLGEKVTVSPSCRAVSTYSILIRASSMQSLMKWNLVSMCLLQWRMGFFAIEMANLLSTSRTGELLEQSRQPNSPVTSCGDGNILYLVGGECHHLLLLGLP